MWYLETTNRISPYQAGFRHNRNSTDYIIQLENIVRQEIAKKNHTIAVFFDIQKAYDITWRHYIVMKLSNFGLRGLLIYFVKHFLSQRKIKVKVNNIYSQSTNLNEGVPQGSVLICTCFLIAINEVASNLPLTLHKTIYVDDFLIYESAKNERTIRRQLQLALNSVSRGCDKTGFSFYLSKAKTMHVCRVRGCNKTSPQLVFKNQILRYVSMYKYLGIRVDNSPSWQIHNKHMTQTWKQSLNLLKLLCLTVYCGDILFC